MFRKTIVFVFLIFGVVYGAPHDDFNECSSCNSANVDVQEWKPSSLFTEEVRYYLVTSLQANWIAALQFCQLNGMQLASINSQEEDDKLKEAVKNSTIKRFWTSGADFPENGKFHWMSSGRPLIYVNWGSQQPDNWLGREHCIEYGEWDDKTVSWNDRCCSDQVNFICEARERVSFFSESYFYAY